MVVFCCNKCGSSVKKPQVEKHLSQCSTASLSCMDCHKDFRGNEYVTHTKCISEEQKYAAAGWKAPANRNKGEKKQEEWVETVQAVMATAGSTLMPSARNLLKALTQHENVPRKKPKFMNFVQNVGRAYFDVGTAEQVWTLLETHQKKLKEAEKPEQQVKAKAGESEPTLKGNDVTNGVEEKKSKKDKKKKKKKDADAVEESETAVVSSNDPSSDVSETKSKKKKSKKNKTDAEEQPENAEDSSMNHSAAELPPTSDSAQGETKSKKRKSKKRKNDGEEPPLNISNNAESAIPDDSTIHDDDLKVKKKKKSKTTAEFLENGHNESENTGRPEGKSKKRKHEEITEANHVDDEELSKQLKKQRKAERKAAKTAQNNPLNESNGNESLTEAHVGETPEEIKARQKAERKLARKAGKASSNS